MQNFDVGEQLGKGGFATVYRARCRNTGRDVAIKKVCLESKITDFFYLFIVFYVRRALTDGFTNSNKSMIKLAAENVSH